MVKKVASESYLMLLDKYKEIDNDTLVNNYLIPEDRVDIVPLAGELYKEIMEQLRASYLKSSFWSISNGLIEKLLKSQRNSNNLIVKDKVKFIR